MLKNLCQVLLLLIKSKPNHPGKGGWAGQRCTLPKHLPIMRNKSTHNYGKLAQSGLRGAQRVLAVIVNLNTRRYPTGARTASHSVVMYKSKTLGMVLIFQSIKVIAFPYLYILSSKSHRNFSKCQSWSAFNREEPRKHVQLRQLKVDTYYRRKWGNGIYFRSVENYGDKESSWQMWSKKFL